MGHQVEEVSFTGGWDRLLHVFFDFIQSYFYEHLLYTPIHPSCHPLKPRPDHWGHDAVARASGPVPLRRLRWRQMVVGRSIYCCACQSWGIFGLYFFSCRRHGFSRLLIDSSGLCGRGSIQAPNRTNPLATIVSPV